MYSDLSQCFFPIAFAVHLKFANFSIAIFVVAFTFLFFYYVLSTFGCHAHTVEPALFVCRSIPLTVFPAIPVVAVVAVFWFFATLTDIINWFGEQHFPCGKLKCVSGNALKAATPTQSKAIFSDSQIKIYISVLSGVVADLHAVFITCWL